MQHTHNRLRRRVATFRGEQNCRQRYPDANFILVLQFATASLLLGLAHALGMIKLENINARTSIGFLPFVACFLHFWVWSVGHESRSFRDVIAFKSTTPIALSILDYLFMGRMFPGAKSIVAMIGITIGAIWYVSGDVKSEDVAHRVLRNFCFRGVHRRRGCKRYH